MFLLAARVPARGRGPGAGGRGHDALLVEQNRLGQREFAGDMAKAVYERQQKVREALREWNQRNPHSPLSLNMAAVRRRVIVMRAGKAKRIEQAAPKAVRAEVHKQLSEAAS